MNVIPPGTKARIGSIVRLYPQKPFENYRLHMLANGMCGLYSVPLQFLYRNYTFASSPVLSRFSQATGLFSGLSKRSGKAIYMMAYPGLYQSYAKAVKKRKGIFVFDLHEDHSIQTEEFGGKFTDTQYITNRDRIFRDADLTLVTGSGVIEYYKKCGIEITKPLEVMCAADPKIIPFSPYSDTKNVVCTHTISGIDTYMARGVDVLVQAMNIVSRDVKDASLTVVGCKDESIANRIRQDAAPCLKVNCVGFVDYTKIGNYLASASVCALPLKAKRGGFWNVGTGYKLFEYMAAGRPQVCIEHEGYGAVIKDSGCGLMYDGTPESMASAISNLLADPEKAKEMGHKGRNALVNKHTWKHRAQTLANAIDAIV